jgi:VIT1/CCC1 family predicted Fe2+/Mn2+ transporter
MIKTGWLLFAIGGIVPLVLQISSLPLLLLIASAVEIFLQNFLTGAVAARLLGIERKI